MIHTEPTHKNSLGRPARTCYPWPDMNDGYYEAIVLSRGEWVLIMTVKNDLNHAISSLMRMYTHSPWRLIHVRTGEIVASAEPADPPAKRKTQSILDLKEKFYAETP